MRIKAACTSRGYYSSLFPFVRMARAMRIREHFSQLPPALLPVVYSSAYLTRHPSGLYPKRSGFERLASRSFRYRGQANLSPSPRSKSGEPDSVPHAPTTARVRALVGTDHPLPPAKVGAACAPFYNTFAAAPAERGELWECSLTWQCAATGGQRYFPDSTYMFTQGTR